MALKFSPLLTFAAMLSIISAFEESPNATDCTATKDNMYACMGVNSFVCALNCQQNQLNAINAFTPNCTNNIGFCKASACCPECAVAIDAYKACLLHPDCDQTCSNSTASSPSPSSIDSPSFAAPSFSDDDGFSPECESQATAFLTCLEGNVEECMGPCAILGEESGDAELTCQDIPDSCQDAACCPPCVSLGKAFVTCEAGLLKCEESCSDIAPVAPSPIAPIPSFPPYQSDDMISPECMGAVLSFSTCYKENSADCDSSCANVNDDDSVADPFSCELIHKACDRASCCAMCTSLGSAVIECESSARGCPADCSDSPPSEVPSVGYAPTMSMIPSLSPTNSTSAASKWSTLTCGVFAVVLMNLG